jgi:hypothetical protein
MLVIVFLVPGEKSSRLNFVVDSPFWGQVFNRHHGSTLSSTRLFWGQVRSRHGSTFSSTRLFWSQVRSRHGSTLLSTCLFGASTLSILFCRVDSLLTL